MINRDVEETRQVHAQMRQVEALINALKEATKDVPPHVAMSGLMTCLARLMVVSNIPVDLVAQGLSGIVDMCNRMEE